MSEYVEFLKEVFEQFETMQPGRMFGCHDHFLLYFSPISLTDVCRSAQLADALAAGGPRPSLASCSL